MQNFITMTEIKFTKMHGCGNDYIYIDATQSCPDNLQQLAVAMSNRHTGVGSDGLVLVMKSEVADFRMRMFNADGSEAQMCGNAARCVGKFVYDNNLTDKTTITLETLAGIKTIDLHLVNGIVESATVDMGSPILDAPLIPVALPVGKVINHPVITESGVMRFTAVSMGNPHAVFFVNEITDTLVNVTGRELEVNPIFPEKANIEFARVINDHEIEMRVWERGSGETMACGTGACATAVAAHLTGLAAPEVTIHLLGGDLHIRWDKDTDRVYLTGPAVTTFHATYLLQ